MQTLPWWKQDERAGNAPRTCARCDTILDSAGLCFWHDHGCRGCGQPVSHHDGFCAGCGLTTWRCPGAGCKSTVHEKSPAA